MKIEPFVIFIFLTLISCGLTEEKTNLVNVGDGWARTSVNAAIFRKYSVVSHGEHQYIAYYDSAGRVVLAKRELNSREWQKTTTPYNGNVRDAHNVISIMVDGKGYLHMAWDHHGHPLKYCRSKEPGSLEMGSNQSMTGTLESNVTYPGFHRFPSGDLLFAYRDGSSGNGNLVLKKYETGVGQWTDLHTNVINGEGERNAYWQMCIDRTGTIHLSWVWRESPDVASNHDMCYARSTDGGKTWLKSGGEKYTLPITLATAEVIYPIEQGSNLINQTAITTDNDGNPYIATYFKGSVDSATQFKVIFKDGNSWKVSTVTKRKTDFNLGGMGTRSIPISRPQIVFSQKRNNLLVIYRDEEYDNKMCLASNKLPLDDSWDISQLTSHSMERWEPSYDAELWAKTEKLHIFHQVVGQQSGEQATALQPQPVGILEVE